ncbi:MAG: hydroxyacid dehydrogenase [Clostridiales bacterium]|jgi:phosphoglycerate dehydrogenase-like enzyme|nr:hydroxyacid dehydrogenase [Clostridiales bacterium]
MKIWVLMPDNEIRRMFFPEEVASFLESQGEVTWNPTREHYGISELREKLPQFDAIVTGWGCARIGAEVLGEKAPSLLLHTGGTVAPFVDKATFEKGVRVSCANEIYARSVAEGTLAYMLAGLRRITYWDSVVKKGSWRGTYPGNSGLYEKKVGLTGYGAITRYLLPLLKVFDTKIYLCSSHMTEEEAKGLGVYKADLDFIFSSCDVVSLHNALTVKTKGMIGARLLSMLKEGAVFVNTARGQLIDESALAKVLAEKNITAVLDVYEKEPLDANSPLLKLENAILMPHVAGPTADRYPSAGRHAALEIERFIAGLPLETEVQASSVEFMTNL